MSEDLRFEEIPRALDQSVCCFVLRQAGRRTDVYLYFRPHVGSWHLALYNTVSAGRSAVRSTSTIMEIAGIEDNPPIDLALATLALMGY